ncbi:MerR family transcriptional regulator [Bacillus clarus]|uniref:MerR family transcriptional regulator n=1 Tax=Bacillus clarus TaxID=2338372 RepID=A0A090ZBL8_9BACI|nr:merR regulatory family protein [Bacillus clarus]RFT68229.1 MerR family transcriptional regulator [Bacillus clarus]
MSKKESYSIGEISKRTGTSIRTLHYYDEMGLPKSEKNVSSGHRIYKGQNILTLQKIASLKVLGYNLDEISIKKIVPYEGDYLFYIIFYSFPSKRRPSPPKTLPSPLL